MSQKLKLEKNAYQVKKENKIESVYQAINPQRFIYNLQRKNQNER
jgi:hypothetical protein